MFTSEEIQMIFDGLDALESKDGMSDAMGMLFGAMLIQDDEKRQEFQLEQELKAKAKERVKRIQKERIILLKAKLIQMKDKAFIEELD